MVTFRRGLKLIVFGSLTSRRGKVSQSLFYAVHNFENLKMFDIET